MPYLKIKEQPCMNEVPKILLIEDDTVDRMFFERALKATDLATDLVVVEDAEKAIEEELDKIKAEKISEAELKKVINKTESNAPKIR